MNKIKCIQCGLVNWPDAVECKRCGSLLTVQERIARQASFDGPQIQPLFSGALKFLTAILALAGLAFLFSRLFPVIPDDLAKIFAVLFMLGGMVLLIVTRLWLIVRIFEQSIGWGFGALFIPLVGLFAVITFWEKTKRSFVGQLVCLGIVFVGYLIVPPEFRQ